MTIQETLVSFDETKQRDFRVGLAMQFTGVSEGDIRLTASRRRMLASEAISLMDMVHDLEPNQAAEVIIEHRRRLSTITVTSRIIFQDLAASEAAANTIQGATFAADLSGDTGSTVNSLSAPVI